MKAPEAGNTTTSLTPVDVNVAAAAQNAPATTDTPATVTEVPAVDETPVVTPDAPEATEDDAEELAKQVEFEQATVAALQAELADTPEPEYVLKSDFDALLARIENFNSRSGHRI